MIKTEAPCILISYLLLHTPEIYKIHNSTGFTFCIFPEVFSCIDVYLQHICSYKCYPLEARITQKIVLKAGIMNAWLLMPCGHLLGKGLPLGSRL